MKNHLAISLSCLLATAVPGAADTFTLKDGTVLEGTILSETADTYVLEVQVTKSIKDERRVPKDQVAKIDREKPDEKAFEAVAPLATPPDLLSEDDYASHIIDVEKFLREHPSSAKARDAKKILETLKAEAAHVAAGGIKLDGKLLSPDDYRLNQYEVDARVEAAKIRQLIEQNRYLEALRQFEAFERDYRTTNAYGEVIASIRDVIRAYVGDVKQSLMTLESRQKQREVGLQRMDLEDRRNTESAIAEETAAVEERYKSEKSSGSKWISTHAFHKASLEETVKHGEAEMARLSSAKPALGTDGGRAYRELWVAVHRGGNAAAVTSALAEAKKAGIPPRYLAPLEEAAKGRK